MTSQADLLREQAATLLQRASDLDALPQDDFPDETVLLFTHTFSLLQTPGPRTFTYAALKKGNVWYLTGRSNLPGRSNRMTWSQLLQFAQYDEPDHPIWVVTAWEEV